MKIIYKNVYLLALSLLPMINLFAMESANSMPDEQIKTKKIALLLEGKKAVLQHHNGNFRETLDSQPDLYYLDQMAQMNQWTSFDPIVSRDFEHFKYVFSKLPKEQHEKLVHVILDFFRPTSALDALTIKLFIYPAYTHFLKETNAKEYPAWFKAIANMDNNTIQNKKREFINHQYSKIFTNPIEGYEKDKLALLTWLDTSSNQLSAKDLEQYLKQNPDVTDVLGLVGYSHLGISKKLSKDVQEIGATARKFQYNANGRIVNIILFGSRHPNLAYYDEFADYALVLGYQVPVLDKGTAKFKADLERFIADLRYNKLPVPTRLLEKLAQIQEQIGS